MEIDKQQQPSTTEDMNKSRYTNPWDEMRTHFGGNSKADGSYLDSWKGPAPVPPMFSGESLVRWKTNNGIKNDEGMAKYLADRGLEPEARLFDNLKPQK